MSYFNADFNHFQYFSAENYRECAEKMEAIFKVFQQIERAQPANEKPAETPLNEKIDD
ncbi:MAG: hypothetical protein K2G38_00210 [Clostridia bacterium]|nr:hypothetical protein [Clostridia bacterium]